MERRGEMVVVTYNVHGCVGTDRRLDVGRVIDVLRELDADVIGLQEVDSHPFQGSDVRQLAVIAEALDLHAIAGPTVLDGSGEFGNGLLTRLPAASVQWVDLSYKGQEPRGAIDALLDLDGGEVRCVVTHLGLWPGERRAQIKRITTALVTSPQPVVLLGDINEWLAWGRPLRLLHRAFGFAPSVRSFPSRLPLLSLDRVWARPSAALVAVQAHDSRLSRLASDHLPVRARISLPRLWQ